MTHSNRDLYRFIRLLWLIISFSSCLKLQEPVALPSTLSRADSLTLVAAGDNIFYNVMIRPSQEDGTYDFMPFYTAIKPLIEAADIGFINQETLLAGREFGFSGYPLFNTPQELGKTLISLGFRVINHANNHVMDKGERAVFTTMDFWDSHPTIAYLGIHRSQRDRNKRIILEKNNIKLGFLAYTYGTNSLPIPKDKPYLVSLIDLEVMAKEIDALRPYCDVLIVSMHWGTEYEQNYNATQERLSKFLAKHQVDLIIGHHPHVLQPVAFLPRNDGGRTLCVYSLGNFISAQDMNPTLLGGLLYLKLKKRESQVSIEQAGIIPVVTHYEQGYTNMRVYPLYDYTEALAEKHWNKERRELSLSYFHTLAQKILGEALITANPFTGSD
jgi:poly-gamma-glutamate synthesis protein (capsule biosynthesis protein)